MSTELWKFLEAVAIIEDSKDDRDKRDEIVRIFADDVRDLTKEEHQIINMSNELRINRKDAAALILETIWEGVIPTIIDQKTLTLAERLFYKVSLYNSNDRF